MKLSFLNVVFTLLLTFSDSGPVFALADSATSEGLNGESADGLAEEEDTEPQVLGFQYLYDSEGNSRQVFSLDDQALHLRGFEKVYLDEETDQIFYQRKPNEVPFVIGELVSSNQAVLKTGFRFFVDSAIWGDRDEKVYFALKHKTSSQPRVDPRVEIFAEMMAAIENNEALDLRLAFLRENGSYSPLTGSGHPDAARTLEVSNFQQPDGDYVFTWNGELVPFIRIEKKTISNPDDGIHGGSRVQLYLVTDFVGEDGQLKEAKTVFYQHGYQRLSTNDRYLTQVKLSKEIFGKDDTGQPITNLTLSGFVVGSYQTYVSVPSEHPKDMIIHSPVPYWFMHGASFGEQAPANRSEPEGCLASFAPLRLIANALSALHRPKPKPRPQYRPPHQ